MHFYQWSMPVTDFMVVAFSHKVVCSMKVNPKTSLGKQLVHFLTTWWHHSVVWKLNCFDSRAVLLVHLVWEDFHVLFYTIKDWRELLICSHKLYESPIPNVDNCFPSLCCISILISFLHLHKLEQKSSNLLLFLISFSRMAAGGLVG